MIIEDLFRLLEFLDIISVETLNEPCLSVREPDVFLVVSLVLTKRIVALGKRQVQESSYIKVILRFAADV